MNDEDFALKDYLNGVVVNCMMIGLDCSSRWKLLAVVEDTKSTNKTFLKIHTAYKLDVFSFKIKFIVR